MEPPIATDIMRVRFTETKDLEIPDFPYVATYKNNSKDTCYVLVTGKGIDEEHMAGTMINENPTNKPFVYTARGWLTSFLKPFHGVIEIECP